MDKLQHLLGSTMIRLLSFVVFLVLIGVFVNLSKSSTQNKQVTSMDVTARPTATPTALPNKTYISKKLGISFSYIPLIPNGIGQYFFLKEIDNTVYLYTVAGKNQPFEGTDEEFLNTVADSAKYIEVFDKDPNLSLIDAVKEKALPGYSGSDCTVKKSHYSQAREDKTLDTVVIHASIPFNPSLTFPEVRAMMAKCSSYTEQLAGISYFLMDPKHPSKFVFIRVGQDDVPSGVGGYMWDGTIKLQ